MPPLQDALAETVHYLALQPRHSSRVYAAFRTQQCLRNTARVLHRTLMVGVSAFYASRLQSRACHSLSDAAINQAGSPSQDAKKSLARYRYCKRL